MTLPLPTLDTLRYGTLVAEATELLPFRAPEWTDQNAHDPGITLLELLAWLTEANSYRLDRLPTRSERTFLRLLGYDLQPAAVARAVVVFRPVSAAVRLPAAVQVSTGHSVQRFQIGPSFDVLPAGIVAMGTASGSSWLEHDLSSTASFMPLGANPSVGDAFYVGFDRALAGATRVRLYAMGSDPADDARTWRDLYKEHRRSRHGRRRGCRSECSCVGRLREHFGARVSWEYYNGTRWQALPHLLDATRALSLSGSLRFQAPADMEKGGAPRHAELWFIRCRLVSGAYDCPPRLNALLLNAILALHAADNPVVNLGASTGHALQRFDLSHDPIVPGSTQVTLTLPDGTQSSWEERPDFDRSGPLARHHVVDTSQGQIVFGDGRAGRVPDAAVEPDKAAKLFARWKTGSGPGGNLPGGERAVVPTVLAVTVGQPTAAWGGATAESLGAAKARAVRSIAEARCCVTLQDFEQAALRVPGAPVARARAVAEFDPRLPCLPVAGCVTVVVISPCVRARRDPTPGLCHAVRCYLDMRRPVATEVHVTGPEWTTITVKAVLRVRRNSNAQALRAEAARRIDAFFDPLTGGPSNTGWPFGRPAFRTEVLALLDALRDVVAVEDLALVAGDGNDDRCNNIALCPNGLVRPGTHQLTALLELTP